MPATTALIRNAKQEKLNAANQAASDRNELEELVRQDIHADATGGNPNQSRLVDYFSDSKDPVTAHQRAVDNHLIHVANTNDRAKIAELDADIASDKADLAFQRMKLKGTSRTGATINLANNAPLVKALREARKALTEVYRPLEVSGSVAMDVPTSDRDFAKVRAYRTALRAVEDVHDLIGFFSVRLKRLEKERLSVKSRLDSRPNVMDPQSELEAPMNFRLA